MSMRVTSFPATAARARRARGFTLIEVMVVVAIIGIIASIAYPSYQQHIIKSYRASAKACMLEHAQFMERAYTTEMEYPSEDPALACSTANNLNQRYTIAANAPTSSTYTITATPIGAQTADATCGTLTLNQTGNRTISGTGAVGDCW